MGKEGVWGCILKCLSDTMDYYFAGIHSSSISPVQSFSDTSSWDTKLILAFFQFLLYFFNLLFTLQFCFLIDPTTFPCSGFFLLVVFIFLFLVSRLPDLFSQIGSCEFISSLITSTPKKQRNQKCEAINLSNIRILSLIVPSL